MDIPLYNSKENSEIEKAILKKTHTFDYKALGCRGDLIINIYKCNHGE
jgi:hypothetical protein